MRRERVGKIDGNEEPVANQCLAIHVYLERERDKK